jgi:hypothetical protein
LEMSFMDFSRKQPLLIFFSAEESLLVLCFTCHLHPSSTVQYGSKKPPSEPMPCLKLWIETLRIVHGAKLKLKMALLGFFADQNLRHGLSFFKPCVQHLTTISVRCCESPKCIKMLHIYQAMLSVLLLVMLSSVVSESQTN